MTEHQAAVDFLRQRLQQLDGAVKGFSEGMAVLIDEKRWCEREVRRQRKALREAKGGQRQFFEG